MNKACAKCQKTVYPTEELRCLDQSFHKFCFKCDTCGMTLNMKNYKGYNRKPYCNTHYPTTKFTAIADTPEMQRIAENTKIQSNIKYHAEFEKQKGKKTSVIHDPETDRIRQNTAIQSQIQYQNVAAKKHEMEARRPEQVMEGRRGRINPGKISEYEPPASQSQPPPQSYTLQQSRNSSDIGYSTAGVGVGVGHQAAQVYDSERGDVQNGQRRRQPGSISDYDPMAAYAQQQNYPAPAPVPAEKEEEEGAIKDVNSAEAEQEVEVCDQDNPCPENNNNDKEICEFVETDVQEAGFGASEEDSAVPTIGIENENDNEPLVDSTNNINDGTAHDGHGDIENTNDVLAQDDDAGAADDRIAPDNDVLAQDDDAGAADDGIAPDKDVEDTELFGDGDSYGKPRAMPSYRAIYDYTAADDDEVSFREGDIIIDCEIIDEGWMVGRVKKSGSHGMLPSNYVEPI